MALKLVLKHTYSYLDGSIFDVVLYLQMFPLYNSIQSRMPYLMHFKMKYISKYFFGCNILKSA